MGVWGLLFKIIGFLHGIMHGVHKNFISDTFDDDFRFIFENFFRQITFIAGFRDYFVKTVGIFVDKSGNFFDYRIFRFYVGVDIANWFSKSSNAATISSSVKFINSGVVLMLFMVFPFWAYKNVFVFYSNLILKSIA